jgi:hypothetical protein
MTVSADLSSILQRLMTKSRLGTTRVISGPRTSLCTAVIEKQSESVWRGGAEIPPERVFALFIPSAAREGLRSDKGWWCGFLFLFLWQAFFMHFLMSFQLFIKIEILLNFSLKCEEFGESNKGTPSCTRRFLPLRGPGPCSG